MELIDVITNVKEMTWPILQACLKKEAFEKKWQPGAPGKWVD